MVWISKSGAETAAIQELTKLPPRAAAVVAVALVHDRLGTRVGEKFTRTGDTKKKLFGENGPLSSFDIQSKMAYTLGIISKRAFNDCLRIGRIRNRFAHRLEVVDFDHSDVASECQGLELVQRHLFEQQPPHAPPDSPADGISPKTYIKDLAAALADNRMRFQLTAMLLTTSLTQPFGVVGGVAVLAQREWI